MNRFIGDQIKMERKTFFFADSSSKMIEENILIFLFGLVVLICGYMGFVGFVGFVDGKGGLDGGGRRKRKKKRGISQLGLGLFA